MPKTNQERMDDTLAYIEKLLGKPAKQTIEALFDASPAKLTIKSKLELGGVRIVKIAAETERRRAIRAYLLAAATIKTMSETGLAKERPLILLKTKDTLDRELKSLYAKISYVAIPSGSAVDVVKFAVENLATVPTYDNSVNIDFLDWQKGVVNTTQSQFNCYTSLVYWAFHGGAISYKWLREYQKASRTVSQSVDASQEAMAAMLRQNSKKVDQTSPVGGGIQNIAAGATIIYERKGNPLGHTVMSIGNGKCVSHNNVRGIPVSIVNKEPKLAQDMAMGRPHVCALDIYGQIYPPEQGYTLISAPPFWTLYGSAEL